MNYDYDDSDDILDDIDQGVEDIDQGGDVFRSLVEQSVTTGAGGLPHSSTEALREEKDPAALVQRMVAAGRSPLIEATRDHEPELIEAAHAAGEMYPEKTDVAMLVAKGIRIDDLDAWHHQSAKGISQTLDAVKAAGADINIEIDGVPAAHRLAAYYGEKIVGNFYDNSYAAQVGVTDRGQAERLAVFVEKGVDFSTKDAEGRSPLQIIDEIAKREANARGTGEAPLMDYVRGEMAPVRQAARDQRVSQAATRRAAETMAKSESVKRPTRDGPSLDD